METKLHKPKAHAQACFFFFFLSFFLPFFFETYFIVNSLSTYGKNQRDEMVTFQKNFTGQIMTQSLKKPLVPPPQGTFSFI
jgi:hypothetical protein